MDTLVLNAAYQPIAIESWQKVLTKLHAEKASDRVEIVAVYPDKYLRSAYSQMNMPSVVRHVKMPKHKGKGIKYSGENVWARDKGRCQYCGLQVPRSQFTRDHVIPKSRGGKSSFDNIVTACHNCNNRKANRTPQEAGMKLLSVPKKPTVLPTEFKPTLRWSKGMPDEWKIFFGPQYWYGENAEESE